MTMLVATGVCRRFGARAAVTEASLSLESGEVTCLLGPSGSGKSTLLRLLAGLDRPDSGEITIAGRDVAGPGAWVSPERRGIGLVFQDYALFPHLTVRDNIGFGLNMVAAGDRRARTDALIEMFHLGDRAAAFPAQLSGGEQQRVAIARALAPQPSILLMDEPFAGLDSGLRRDVQEDVLGQLRLEGAAILLVTHDPNDAMRHGDKLVLMAAGRVLQLGTPELCYQAPNSVAAASLLGPVNIVPAEMLGGLVGELALVRPEDIRVGEGNIAGQVIGCSYVGGSWEIKCRLEGNHIVNGRNATQLNIGSTRLSMDRFTFVLK